jgi:hypothetical protein
MNINRDELRELVRELVLETLSELADSNDPDAGLAFTPEVAAYLRQYRTDRPKGIPAQAVITELGLDI